ncbi:MAG: type II toxin-antitoxin system Phd/YefM family antitoxin [Myxococcales bacterium]|nr:type II toxin-antitoxin system Phd/YefM family antitoxin [Myxococcales bacterium]
MTWAFQDAKARLSEVARRAMTEGPQLVTVRGRPALVVISQAEFAALNKRKRRPPLIELFRHSPIAGERIDLVRSRDTGRRVDL